jgi:hypothetical protein
MEPPMSANRSPGVATRPVSGRLTRMLLKIIGAIVVIWLAFAVLGVVFKVLGTLLIIGAVITVGAIGYAAIKGGSNRKQIR